MLGRVNIKFKLENVHAKPDACYQYRYKSKENRRLKKTIRDDYLTL